MSIKLVAKVAHDVLPNDIIQVCLPDTDNTRDDRHHEHDGNEDDEQVQIAFANSIIKDILDQKRVDQAQYSREKDGDENQYHLYFVSAKSLGDPAHSAYIGFAPTLFQFVGIVFQSSA